jgi:hypothetical protein
MSIDDRRYGVSSETHKFLSTATKIKNNTVFKLSSLFWTSETSSFTTHSIKRHAYLPSHKVPLEQPLTIFNDSALPSFIAPSTPFPSFLFPLLTIPNLRISKSFFTENLNINIPREINIANIANTPKMIDKMIITFCNSQLKQQIGVREGRAVFWGASYWFAIGW